MSTETQNIIVEIKESLNLSFPGMIAKIILFGSQLLKDPLEDADYDFLVVLKNDYDWKLKHKILDVCFDTAIKYNQVFDIKVISEKELSTDRGKQPFVLEALEHGVLE